MRPAQSRGRPGLARTGAGADQAADRVSRDGRAAILLGAVGLQVLSGMNARTEELIELQRKIAAYRQVQHDTTRQLYGVATALLSEDPRELDGILRQLSQFGYDLDRLQHVAEDEVDLLASVREDYDRFIAIVTKAVERARAGEVADARAVQLQRGAAARRPARAPDQPAGQRRRGRHARADRGEPAGL